jgi:hypothetical protein
VSVLIDRRRGGRDDGVLLLAHVLLDYLGL